MFDKYIVGQDGVVVSKYNGKPLSSHVDKKGYHRVSIHCKDGRKTCLLHRMVALEHIPNPGNLPQVNHLDGNKSNNNVSNLEWTTGKDNVKHSVTTGLVKRGSERTNSKLTEAMVLDMRGLREFEKLTYYTLSDMFGVSYQTVHKVCARITYTHI